MSEKLRQAAQQALEALEDAEAGHAAQILRAALAEPQEPEVWFCPDCGTISEARTRCCPDWIRSRRVTKNFAQSCRATFLRAGLAEQQEPLTEAELSKLVSCTPWRSDETMHTYAVRACRALERAHGIGEQT